MSTLITCLCPLLDQDASCKAVKAAEATSGLHRLSIKKAHGTTIINGKKTIEDMSHALERDFFFTVSKETGLPAHVFFSGGEEGQYVSLKREFVNMLHFHPPTRTGALKGTGTELLQHYTVQGHDEKGPHTLAYTAEKKRNGNTVLTSTMMHSAQSNAGPSGEAGPQTRTDQTKRTTVSKDGHVTKSVCHNRENTGRMEKDQQQDVGCPKDKATGKCGKGGNSGVSGQRLKAKSGTELELKCVSYSTALRPKAFSNLKECPDRIQDEETRKPDAPKLASFIQDDLMGSVHATMLPARNYQAMLQEYDKAEAASTDTIRFDDRFRTVLQRLNEDQQVQAGQGRGGKADTMMKELLDADKDGSIHRTARQVLRGTDAWTKNGGLASATQKTRERLIANMMIAKHGASQHAILKMLQPDDDTFDDKLKLNVMAMLAMHTVIHPKLREHIEAQHEAHRGTAEGDVLLSVVSKFAATDPEGHPKREALLTRLRAEVKHGSRPDRIVALSALGNIADEQDLAVFAAALREDDTRVRAQGVRSLRRMHGKEASLMLMHQLVVDPSDEVKSESLKMLLDHRHITDRNMKAIAEELNKNMSPSPRFAEEFNKRLKERQVEHILVLAQSASQMGGGVNRSPCTTCLKCRESRHSKCKAHDYRKVGTFGCAGGTETLLFASGSTIDECAQAARARGTRYFSWRPAEVPRAWRAGSTHGRCYAETAGGRSTSRAYSCYDVVRYNLGNLNKCLGDDTATGRVLRLGGGRPCSCEGEDDRMPLPGAEQFFKPMFTRYAKGVGNDDLYAGLYAQAIAEACRPAGASTNWAATLSAEGGFNFRVLGWHVTVIALKLSAMKDSVSGWGDVGPSFILFNHEFKVREFNEARVNSGATRRRRGSATAGGEGGGISIDSCDEVLPFIVVPFPLGRNGPARWTRRHNSGTGGTSTVGTLSYSFEHDFRFPFQVKISFVFEIGFAMGIFIEPCSKKSGAAVVGLDPVLAAGITVRGGFDFGVVEVGVGIDLALFELHLPPYYTFWYTANKFQPEGRQLFYPRESCPNIFATAAIQLSWYALSGVAYVFIEPIVGPTVRPLEYYFPAGNQGRNTGSWYFSGSFIVWDFNWCKLARDTGFTRLSTFKCGGGTETRLFDGVTTHSTVQQCAAAARAKGTRFFSWAVSGRCYSEVAGGATTNTAYNCYRLNRAQLTSQLVNCASRNRARGEKLTSWAGGITRVARTTWRKTSTSCTHAAQGERQVRTTRVRVWKKTSTSCTHRAQGNQGRFGGTGTEVQCQRRCNGVAACKGFSYRRAGRACFFFTRNTCASVLGRRNTYSTAVGTGSCTSAWCNYDVTFRRVQHFTFHAMTASAMGSAAGVATVSACQARCNGSTSCRGFSFRRSAGRTAPGCWFFRNTCGATKRTGTYTYQPGSTSPTAAWSNYDKTISFVNQNLGEGNKCHPVGCGDEAAVCNGHGKCITERNNRWSVGCSCTGGYRDNYCETPARWGNLQLYLKYGGHFMDLDGYANEPDVYGAATINLGSHRRRRGMYFRSRAVSTNRRRRGRSWWRQYFTSDAAEISTSTGMTVDVYDSDGISRDDPFQIGRRRMVETSTTKTLRPVATWTEIEYTGYLGQYNDGRRRRGSDGRRRACYNSGCNKGWITYQYRYLASNTGRRRSNVCARRRARCENANGPQTPAAASRGMLRV